MRTSLHYLSVALLAIVGIGLLTLTNAGLLTFTKPYIVRASAGLRPPPDAVAFVNVTVLPMDSERLLPGQTVVVRDGRIAQVGPVKDVSVPAGILSIDGTGQYLMPGLTDAHVHIKDENELLLFVAHGVTTVREMWGTTGWQLKVGFPDQLQLRQRIQQGTLLGPTIYAAGPVMEGAPPTSPLMPVIGSPEAARQSVAWQASQGYDYVKVYDHLDTETYQAIVEAAAATNLPVVGHVPFDVGIDGVLTGPQLTIEHLTGYIDPDAAAFRIPEDRLEEYAARTRAEGVWNCPTLGVYTKLVRDAELARLEASPGMEHVPPRVRATWPLMLRGLRSGLTYAGEDYPRRITAVNTRMVQTLHAAGAGIILGTDTNNPYLVPGLSLLDELDLLVAAGLTPFEALDAGTRNAAEALGHPEEFGRIAPGQRADLLLVKANPLHNVSAVRQRAGVMVQGRWFTEGELQTMLAELAASYRPSWPQQLLPVSVLGVGMAMVARRVSSRNRK